MPGRWLVLTVRVPSDEQTAELSEGLVALGSGAVLEDGDRLVAYMAPPPDLDAFLVLARDRLRAVAAVDPNMTWRWQDDEDWSARWREGLVPRPLGRRLVVTQPWNDVAPPSPESVVLVIDPGTAFGTGEHASTRGVLRLMEQVMEGGERVLDVGTGSGILALAAAGLGATSVLAVESDGSSLDNARENLDRSPWGAGIELVHGEVDATFLAAHSEPGFDLIVANVLSSVLVPLLPSFATTLRRSGRVVLAGILESEAVHVLDAATEAGLIMEAEDREESWWSVVLRRTA